MRHPHPQLLFSLWNSQLRVRVHRQTAGTDVRLQAVLHARYVTVRVSHQTAGNAERLQAVLHARYVTVRVSH